MSEIRCEGLSHVYSVGTPFEKKAIDDITVSLPQGQLVGIIGHTGSGKSTFIQHLNALLAPTSGRVLYGEKDINEDKTSRRDIKRSVGLVFQYPEYQLFEETVFRDIAFGPRNMGLSEEEIAVRVREAAAFVGIDGDMFDQSPLELSGGQKRRIAIAGVIAMRPDVLVLDEPTAGLDPEGCSQILKNICDYRDKTSSTVVIVSHNMDDVARICERVIVFSEGRIVSDGTPKEVFSDPGKLIELGLDVPKSTEIAMELKKAGIELEDGICTHEQLMSALLAYGEVKSC